MADHGVHDSRELYERTLVLIDAVLARGERGSSDFSEMVLSDALDDIIGTPGGPAAALAFLADLLGLAMKQIAAHEQRTPAYVWKRMRLLVLEQLEP